MVHHHLFQPRSPVATQGALPIVLLYPGKWVCSFPTALPMGGARIQPARQQQNSVHVQKSRKSPAKWPGGCGSVAEGLL
jgi:hypothetical protein